MFNFLFGGVSLKKMVMKKLNAKIADQQARLNENLKEVRQTKKTNLFVAWDEYIEKRKAIIRDSKYNEEKMIDTHVTNLLNKII